MKTHGQRLFDVLTIFVGSFVLYLCVCFNLLTPNIFLVFAPVSIIIISFAKNNSFTELKLLTQKLE